MLNDLDAQGTQVWQVTEPGRNICFRTVEAEMFLGGRRHLQECSRGYGGDASRFDYGKISFGTFLLFEPECAFSKKNFFRKLLNLSDKEISVDFYHDKTTISNI